MKKLKPLPMEQLNKLRPVNIRSLNIGDYVVASPVLDPFEGEVVKIDGLSERVAVRCAHGQIRKFNVTSVFKPISHGLFIPGDKAWIIVNGVPTEIEIDGVDITPDTKEYFVHPLGLPNMKFTVPSSELFATRKEVKIDKNVWKTAPRGINELFDLSPVYDDTVSSK